MFDLPGDLGTIASQPIFPFVEHLDGALYELVVGPGAHGLLHYHVDQFIRHGNHFDHLLGGEVGLHLFVGQGERF